MNNKSLYTIITIILFLGIFTVFATVVYAKNANFLCSNKQKMVITLKNETDMDSAKKKISKIPKLKIIKIQDRNKEWSRMVNKMDLPNMDNPFKNEITVSLGKKANINGIYSQIKNIDFVENIQDISDKKCTEK